MVFIKLLNEFAKIPAKVTTGSAGFDIYASEEVVINSRGRGLVGTGFSMAFEGNMYARVAPRSGLAVKGIDTGAGVIDSDYRGELKVLLINNSNENFQVKVGDRIAQLIFETYEPKVHFEQTENLETTQRQGGFGSTGLRD
jgi:dUTP pyrophosphatase